MNGPAVMTYMKRLCAALDDDSPIERFQWRHVVAPLALPTILGGALLASGCPEPAVDLYGTPHREIEICGDGVDNDHDGRIDCQDDSCAGHMSCSAVPAYGVPHPAIENCTDKQDNNGNGLIDCQDPMCSSQQVCRMPPPSPQPTLYGAPMEVCTDGVDNDGDGAVDCLDTQCNGQPVCAPAVGAYGTPPMDNAAQRYRAPFPRVQ